MNYITTRKLIETHFDGRFSMNKVAQNLYLDGKPFNIVEFRDLVYREHSIVLDDDQCIHDVVRSCAAQHTFSPIKDYLNRCQAKHPDLTYCNAQKVLDSVSSQILHISDPLEKAYVTKTLVAAVKRAYEPGHHHNSVLIFRSREAGLYTTEFFAALTPRNYDGDEILGFQDYWILDIGEWLDRKGEIDNDDISDVLRLIKSRILSEQFILVGTPQQHIPYLVDESGNRSFWIIEISKEINIQMLKQLRDLVWAAAVVAYQNNHPTDLDKAEQALNDLANARNYEDGLETAADWLLD